MSNHIALFPDSSFNGTSATSTCSSSKTTDCLLNNNSNSDAPYSPTSISFPNPLDSFIIEPSTEQLYPQCLTPSSSFENNENTYHDVIGLSPFNQNDIEVTNDVCGSSAVQGTSFEQSNSNAAMAPMYNSSEMMTSVSANSSAPTSLVSNHTNGNLSNGTILLTNCRAKVPLSSSNNMLTPSAPVNSNQMSTLFPSLGPANNDGIAPLAPNNIINQTSMAPLTPNNILNQTSMAPLTPNNILNQTSVSLLTSNNILSQTSVAPLTENGIVDHPSQSYKSGEKSYSGTSAILPDDVTMVDSNGFVDKSASCNDFTISTVCPDWCYTAGGQKVISMI